jgi:hypothetical protein
MPIECPSDTEGPWECVPLLQPKPPWTHLSPTVSTSELLSNSRTVSEYLHIGGLSFELDMFGFAVWYIFYARFSPAGYIHAYLQDWVHSYFVGHIILYGSESNHQILEYSALR